MLNNNNKQKEAGFTLIEVLASLAVFTIGIVAIMTLGFSNYNTSRDNLDRIIAANLAREGIELIRNRRDTNWLRMGDNVKITEDGHICDVISDSGVYCAWDFLIGDFGDYLALDYKDNYANILLTEPCFQEGHEGELCVEDPEQSSSLGIDDNGYYAHGAGISTKYSRGIFIERICANKLADNIPEDEYYRSTNFDWQIACAEAGYDPIYVGLKVISRVVWLDGDDTKYVEIIDKLYNWRR